MIIVVVSTLIIIVIVVIKIKIVIVSNVLPRTACVHLSVIYEYIYRKCSATCLFEESFEGKPKSKYFLCFERRLKLSVEFFPSSTCAFTDVHSCSVQPPTFSAAFTALICSRSSFFPSSFFLLVIFLLFFHALSPPLSLSPHSHVGWL